jgi:hypothetical protein
LAAPVDLNSVGAAQIAGLKEDKIAALDGDWSEFTPAQRSAFMLENGVRKRGQEPFFKTGSG